MFVQSLDFSERRPWVGLRLASVMLPWLRLAFGFNDVALAAACIWQLKCSLSRGSRLKIEMWLLMRLVTRNWNATPAED